MIDRTHALPITRHAALVNVSRGSVYYVNDPISDDDLKLMRRIDELHLELPFAGARMLRDLLRAEGFAVGRTIFGEAARAWFRGELDDAAAVATMASRYQRLCDLWDKARAGKGDAA